MRQACIGLVSPGYCRSGEPVDRVRSVAHIAVPEGIPGIRSLFANVAAAFCMFNRYVGGLGALTPTDPAGSRERARFVAGHGYASSLPARS
jgi:hypothetical protein